MNNITTIILCLDNVGLFNYRVQTQIYTTIFLLDLFYYFLEIINNTYYDNLINYYIEIYNIDKNILYIATDTMPIINEYKELNISKAAEISYLSEEITKNLQKLNIIKIK